MPAMVKNSPYFSSKVEKLYIKMVKDMLRIMAPKISNFSFLASTHSYLNRLITKTANKPIKESKTNKSLHPTISVIYPPKIGPNINPPKTPMEIMPRTPPLSLAGNAEVIMAYKLAKIMAFPILWKILTTINISPDMENADTKELTENMINPY